MYRIGIVGYGNLGRACEKIAAQSADFELAGIFTRRDPAAMTSPFGTPFYRQSELADFKGKIDVLALCTGSANDLVDLGKTAAKYFNTVDSFDTHAYLNDLRHGKDTKESEEFHRRLDKYRERYLFQDNQSAEEFDK